IAIGKEQERFYLNYACGEATRNDCSVRGYLRPLGVMEAGSAERKILDMADYELVDWNELEKNLNIDEEMEFEFMDDRRAFSEFLIQCAMGPVLLRIKQEVLPGLDIPKGQDFEATIFNDIEASSLNDRAPRFSAYCLDTDNIMTLFAKICSKEENSFFLAAIHERRFEKMPLIEAAAKHYNQSEIVMA
ncbi:MAG: hypothetical protein GY754_39155, partial [bacterium]|nr:hypothetical protein [bacterium]